MSKLFLIATQCVLYLTIAICAYQAWYGGGSSIWITGAILLTALAGAIHRSKAPRV